MTLPRVIWYGGKVDLSGGDSDGEVGRRGEDILALVHHRIVGSLESAIREFTDETASGQRRRVSSHFGIGYLGAELVIAQFVAVENTAYCNGQSDADRAACRWQTWIKAGKPGTNYITVSTEHEDNGAAGDYVVVEAIVEASIELDRLLLSGDGKAIRAAGIRCSDAAARQLGAIEPSKETLIDHNVCAPISKPYCWRRIGDDKGFPQARFVAALSEDPDMPGLALDHLVPAAGKVRVKNIAGVEVRQVADNEAFGVPPLVELTVIGTARLKGDPLGPDTATANRHDVYLVGGATPEVELAVILRDQVTFQAAPVPEAECDDEVQAALDRAAVRASAAVLAR